MHRTHFPPDLHAFVSKFAKINIYRNEVFGDTTPLGRSAVGAEILHQGGCIFVSMLQPTNGPSSAAIFSNPAGPIANRVPRYFTRSPVALAAAGEESVYASFVLVLQLRAVYRVVGSKWATQELYCNCNYRPLRWIHVGTQRGLTT